MKFYESNTIALASRLISSSINVCGMHSAIEILFPLHVSCAFVALFNDSAVNRTIERPLPSSSCC